MHGRVRGPRLSTPGSSTHHLPQPSGLSDTSVPSATFSGSLPGFRAPRGVPDPCQALRLRRRRRQGAPRGKTWEKQGEPARPGPLLFPTHILPILQGLRSSLLQEASLTAPGVIDLSFSALRLNITAWGKQSSVWSYNLASGI